MADNFETNAGTGGSTFASDDISGVQHTRVKVEWGADGTATDTSYAAPMPVQATLESSQMMQAGVAVTPKFAIVSASSSGNTSTITAVSGKKFRILALYVMANGTVNVKFQSNTTDVTGLSYLVVNTGMVLPYNPVGWFETLATNVALNINLSAAIAVGGVVVYIEV